MRFKIDLLALLFTLAISVAGGWLWASSNHSNPFHHSSNGTDSSSNSGNSDEEETDEDDLEASLSPHHHVGTRPGHVLASDNEVLRRFEHWRSELMEYARNHPEDAHSFATALGHVAGWGSNPTNSGALLSALALPGINRREEQPMSGNMGQLLANLFLGMQSDSLAQQAFTSLLKSTGLLQNSPTTAQLPATGSMMVALWAGGNDQEHSAPFIHWAMQQETNPTDHWEEDFILAMLAFLAWLHTFLEQTLNLPVSR